MPTPQRRLDPPVAQRLHTQFYRFEFFQAVKLLEQLLLRQGLSMREVADRISFANSTSLAFPASEIEALRMQDEEGRWLGEQVDWQGVRIGAVQITPAFFSLLGAHGALPSGYTEQLLQRESQSKERAASAFLDIFVQRALRHFYRAWRKYRLPLCDEQPGRSAYLQALVWLGGGGRRLEDIAQPYAVDHVFDETLGHYAAAGRQRPLSAAYLQRILCTHFDCNIRVEQFAGKWYQVPERQRSALGAGQAVLGRTALVGQRVWQRDLRVRLWIGPLDRSAFDAFYPGQPCSRALARLLKALAGVTYEYEVRLILDRRAIGLLSLESKGDARLGWNCFLCGSGRSDVDRSDAVYELEVLP
ncbi:type VI secretion system baseplate subunit TssG [Comamonas sp. GB3 AK4-5]|uniref:type VI secretion system baseplate subunit TssG n=1 Tax=Comamonas sp. GB3 AK4-5 TaxID=3231487 RepID=UPI00351F6870